MNNDPSMAAAAATATTAQAVAQTNTAYSTSTSSSGSSGTYVSTDRVGGSSYGVVVTNGESKFSPNVEVVVKGNSNNN